MEIIQKASICMFLPSNLNKPSELPNNKLPSLSCTITFTGTSFLPVSEKKFFTCNCEYSRELQIKSANDMEIRFNTLLLYTLGLSVAFTSTIITEAIF